MKMRKADSRYMDFLYFADETARVIITEEYIDAEYILVGFQYIFNRTGDEDKETTLFYMCYERGRFAVRKIL